MIRVVFRAQWTGREIRASGLFYHCLPAPQFILGAFGISNLQNNDEFLDHFWAQGGNGNIQPRQHNLFGIKIVFLTSARESAEAEGGRGAGQEQTSCLQRAKE